MMKIPEVPIEIAMIGNTMCFITSRINDIEPGWRVGVYAPPAGRIFKYTANINKINKDTTKYGVDIVNIAKLVMILSKAVSL
jgi:hypothetical protein